MRKLLIISLIGIMSIFISCKGTDSTVNPIDTSAARVILTADDLPPCNSNSDGLLFYIVNVSEFQYCDGTQFQVIDLSGEDGIDGQNGTDGISVNWLGSLDNSTLLVSPNTNDAFYSTDNGTAYIWDGDSWEVLAMDGNGWIGIDGYSTLLSHSDVEHCVEAIDGSRCQMKTALHVSLATGIPLRIDFNWTDQDLSFIIEKNLKTPGSQQYDMNVTFKHDGGEYKSFVSPEVPVYNTENDPEFNPSYSQSGEEFHWMIQQVTDSQLVIYINQANQVKPVVTESAGIIVEAYVNDDYTGDDTNRTMFVTMENTGDLTTTYLVTITELPDYVDYVNVQQVSVLPGDQVTLLFDLYYLDPNVIVTDIVLVTLMSDIGMEYDSVQVEWDYNQTQ
ncbi:hypothetical protein ACFL20_12400 [Spirochaetota bacterium]